MHSLQRREFLRLLALAAAAGATLRSGASTAQAAAELYDTPPTGNVSLLHFTDAHAQLLPTYFREPSVNLGIGEAAGRPPHLVGDALLRHFGIAAGTARAHAFTFLDFERAARRYGKVGGFAHLATLVKRLRAARPNALVLDGGDSWQGSAVSLWTRGADMIGAQKLLGVDLMTAHWEFTYGAERVRQAVDKELAPIEFIAQNVKTTDFEDAVFKPYSLRSVNGVAVAVIGQAFPYTPIANPRHMVPDWSFGIQEPRMQQMVDEVRAKGARLVVLLSHNGLNVDLKLAARIRGIDVILGGHTHDGVPAPITVGRTLVTNAGSNGKFLGVLDLEVKEGGVTGYRYRLLPVFSNLLPADADMAKYIAGTRAPHEARLREKLAVTDGLLYRRGSFNGTWDQLILDALQAVKGAEIAFSPGFRWGTTLLPGDAITFEHVMDQTAITYPHSTLNEMSGEQIKAILEDVADNLFNPDPYLKQGGDMVRVGGMTYACDPAAKIGQRISDMRLGGRPMQATTRYKVAGWAPVAEGASGEPVWDVVARYLRDRKTIAPRTPSVPRLIGIGGNPGIGVKALLSLVLCMALPALALESIRVSPSVYYVRGDSGAPSQANRGHTSNAGFVVTKEGVVVFDALGTPVLGRELIEAIRKVTPLPIRRVIVSHYHADHIYGLQPLKESGAEIWAHQAARAYLQSDAAQHRLVERRKTLAPWVGADTRLVRADRWLQGEESFRLGGLGFRIFPLGPAHTPEDLALAVEEEGVLFVGDVMFAGRLPFVGDADSKAWIAAIDRIIKLNPKILIGGHGGASRDAAADLRLTRDYLAYLREKMGAAADELEDFEIAYRRTDWSRFSRVPAFEAVNRRNAFNTYIRMQGGDK